MNKPPKNWKPFPWKTINKSVILVTKPNLKLIRNSRNVLPVTQSLIAMWTVRKMTGPLTNCSAKGRKKTKILLNWRRGLILNAPNLPMKVLKLSKSWAMEISLRYTKSS